MKELPQRDDYLEILLGDTPMIDVRAPVEFTQGAFPHTTNLPLMNDEEREAVGIRYKELGQDSAIELGHELVRDEVKQQRVDNWVAFARKHPDGVLYCFRGGLRSKISQQWLYEQSGILYPRIKGGYKALRRFLLDELEKSPGIIQPIMLGGRTGTGKTVLLDRVKDKIDLEGLYHHRGSVFGPHIDPQPSQINIENALSIELLKLQQRSIKNILLEDEAPNIGSRNIPRKLFEKMRQSPLILLETSLEERVDITFDEYITEALAEHRQALGDAAGFKAWTAYLTGALEKTQRRLGGERYQAFSQLMQQAISEQEQSGDTSLHREWIHRMLSEYYDPMYDYQLSKKTARVVFQGEADAVLEFIASHYQIT